MNLILERLNYLLAYKEIYSRNSVKYYRTKPHSKPKIPLPHDDESQVHAVHISQEGGYFCLSLFICETY